jgi:hypothetical protein
VLDLFYASIAPTAQEQDGIGRLREIKGEEACESARRRTFARTASPVLVRHIATALDQGFGNAYAIT